MATINKHPKLIKYLIDNGAKVSMVDLQHKSPIFYAINGQDEECLIILLDVETDFDREISISGNT